MRDRDSGWIQLDSAEFFLLWSASVDSEPPLPLGIRHIGRTRAHRTSLVARADETLAGRDLGTVGAPARDLRGYVRALSAPEFSLDLHAEGQGPELRAMGVVGPAGAAAAAAVGEEVRIGPIHRDAVVTALVEALPAVPAGAGRGANARWADYEHACRQGARTGATGFVETLREAGMRAPEANTFMRAISGRVGGGQLGATTRTERGWVRTPSTVNWVDTPEGRYAIRRKGDWVMATPVDPAQLVAMTDEMIAELR